MTAGRKLLLFFLLTLKTGTGFTQDEEGFSGRAAFGYLATSGNSANETMSGNFDLGWNYATWHHSFKGAAVRASSSSVDTAEAYALDWKTDYDLGENTYAYGLIAWTDDKFSGYESQTRQAIGYGRRFIDTERHMLNGEAGAGSRQAEVRTGMSQDEGIFRLSGDYLWNISETSDFSQTLAIESGSENTFTESVSKLTADIRANFSVVFSYTIRNNSDVPANTKKRDTFTAVALEYTF
ncbi:MAG: YdiY family protein [Candidatus Rariloculaceae bacterium]